MKKEFDLLTKEGKAVIKVKRINIHSYFMSGYQGTPYATVYKRLSVDDFKTYKEKFNLVTIEEHKRRLEKNRPLNETVLDLLIKANHNINTNTGSAHEDNQSESLGKHQLRRVIEMIGDGKELQDSLEVK